MQNGTVIKKNEKGFGFIKVDGASEGAKDLFFHATELVGVTFDELKEGDTLSFEIETVMKNGEEKTNATNVKRA